MFLNTLTHCSDTFFKIVIKKTNHVLKFVKRFDNIFGVKENFGRSLMKLDFQFVFSWTNLHSYVDLYKYVSLNINTR